MRVVIAAMLLVVAAGAADKRLAVGKAENGAVAVSATILDAEHVREAVGSDYDDQYVVLEVTVTPKGAEALAVGINDFTLRSQSLSGEHSGPLAAGQIAGSGELVVKRTYGALANASSTRQIEGTKVEMKNGVAGEAAASKEKIERLNQKMLPEKSTSEPVTGLLFFPMEKQKPKNLALSYAGPKGKLRIEFKQ